MSLSHKNDPITSFEAAETVKGFRTYHHNEIFHTLSRHGSMTGVEIADNCTLDRYQVQRRIREMVKAGLVVDSGEKRTLSSGRRSIIWKVKE